MKNKRKKIVESDELNLELPKDTKIPDHIAIIPDGNRRWARSKGLNTLEGHRAGFDRALEVGRAARNYGVHTVSIWGFSTENWDRSIEEIRYLMKLYEELVDKNLVDAKKENIKIVHLGRKDRLPRRLVKKIINAEYETKDNTKHIINIAIDHGGHDEIIRAVKKMIKDKVKPRQVNKKLFENYLDTKNEPYPYVDLLIRTSGEQRTSGLMLWQMSYAEMYWVVDHLPDFTKEKLRDAILDYSRRRRRFGGNDKESHFQFKPEIVANLELSWWRLNNIPKNTKLTEYAISHIKEQFGLSASLAKKAAASMIAAFLSGKQTKWKNAQKYFLEFYKLIKDEVKLAFEPELAASLEVKLWRQVSESDKLEFTNKAEESGRRLLSEVYRISDFQAGKAAHLRVLAAYEKNLAEQGMGEHHWDITKDLLERYYKALKERIA